MGLEDYTEVEIDEFLGLLADREIADVPPQYAFDCMNNRFAVGGGASRRPGTSTYLCQALAGGPITGAMDHFEFFNLLINGVTVTKYYLMLIGTQLYYSTGGTMTALGSTITGAIKFRVAQYGNLGYVSISDGKVGKAIPKVWSPPGLGNFYDAMTIPAVRQLNTLSNPGNFAGGVTSVGIHKFGVIYQTRSGFQYVGANTDSSMVFTGLSVTVVAGTQLVELSVPADALGSQITRRWIIMTQAGLDSYYIVPDSFITTISGSLANNSGTAVVRVSISDDGLAGGTNADKNLTYTIPMPFMAGSVLYKNRQVMWGNPDNPSILYVSEVDDVQAFRSDVGFVVVNRDDGQRITNAFVKGETLYVLKERSWYAVSDNGAEPSGWSLSKVSEKVGTPSNFGVVSDEEDTVFVFDLRGLYAFKGGEPKLVENLSSGWAALFNRESAHLVELAVDSYEARVYSLVPEPAATENGKILMCDYHEGVNKPKWSPWKPTDATVPSWRTIATDYSGVSANGQLVDLGTCNTSGTTVTWVSGGKWWGVMVGGTITINGVPYTIASITSSTVLVLTSSAGTQSGVAWSFSGAAFPIGGICVAVLGTSDASKMVYFKEDKTSDVGVQSDAEPVEGYYWTGGLKAKGGMALLGAVEVEVSGSVGNLQMQAGGIDVETAGVNLGHALVLGGTCDTSGTTVTITNYATKGVPYYAQGRFIYINGVRYTIQAVSAFNSLTLTATAGTQTGVAWRIGQPVPSNYGPFLLNANVQSERVHLLWFTNAASEDYTLTKLTAYIQARGLRRAS